MSEFQTSLALIGALVVVAVILYNKWQEHRAGKSADEAFRSDHPDVLVSPHEDPAPDPGVETAALSETGPAPAPHASVHGGGGGTGDPASPVANPAIDYLVELSGEQALASAALREGWSGIEHRFSRRAHLYGWIDSQWTALPLGGTCERARAALQLVSRKGVVGESELVEFRSAVETLAAALRASVQAPEMKQALEGARRLDSVCAEADIQIAFHVVSAGGPAFPGTKLRAAAEAAGFALDSEGRYFLADDKGRVLYSLTDRSGERFLAGSMKDSAPKALTLSMDVPTAPDTHRTFDGMVRFARSLAGLLGGSLVDDNNQPLDDRAVAAIDAQLTLVCRGLEDQGILPGSALALRLFS
jgi:FtsZ-interacting cell division protein ZipA